MSLWTAFMLGLLGGAHCAAMCGPLVLALPVPPGGPWRFAFGRLIYQFGRILTYCSLGLVAGLLGKTLALAGVQRWASVGLGVALLAGLFASKRLLGVAPVVRLVARLKAAMSGLLRLRTYTSLALLGGLNGLLPCGLVYVAAAGAISAGSILRGAEYMAVFGLGTLPTLFGISLSGRILPVALRLRFRRAAPVGVAVVAVLLILRGLSLGVPYLSPDLSSGMENARCHSQ